MHFERDHLFGLTLAHTLLCSDEAKSVFAEFPKNPHDFEKQAPVISHYGELCATSLTSKDLDIEEAREIAYAAGYFDAMLAALLTAKKVEEELAEAA